MTGVEFRARRSSATSPQRWEAAATVPTLGEYALIGVSTIMDHEGQDVA